MIVVACDICGKPCAGVHAMRIERINNGPLTLSEDPGPWDFCSFPCLRQSTVGAP